MNDKPNHETTHEARITTSWPGLRKTSIRVGYTEREVAVADLARHAAEGRLSADELDDRVGAAYQARTVHELDALLEDLPSTTELDRATPHPKSIRAMRQRLFWPAVRVLGILGAAGGGWSVTQVPQVLLLLAVLGLTRSRLVAIITTLALLGGHIAARSPGGPVVLLAVVIAFRVRDRRTKGG